MPEQPESVMTYNKKESTKIPSFNSIGVDRTNKFVVYHISSYEQDPLPYIGKFIRIDNKLRKLINAYRWILSGEIDSGRYKLIVRH